MLKEHVDYDSFGTMTTVRGSTGSAKSLAALDTVFGFAGRDWDNDTSLYYNRARWFDPRLGRFISTDPLGFGGGDTNLYRYGGNNPIDHIDPSGNSWLSSAFRHLKKGVIKGGNQRGRESLFNPKRILATHGNVGSVASSLSRYCSIDLKNCDNVWAWPVVSSISLGFFVRKTLKTPRGVLLNPNFIRSTPQHGCGTLRLF